MWDQLRCVHAFMGWGVWGWRRALSGCMDLGVFEQIISKYFFSFIFGLLRDNQVGRRLIWFNLHRKQSMSLFQSECARSNQAKQYVMCIQNQLRYWFWAAIAIMCFFLPYLICSLTRYAIGVKYTPIFGTRMKVVGDTWCDP